LVDRVNFKFTTIGDAQKHFVKKCRARVRGEWASCALRRTGKAEQTGASVTFRQKGGVQVTRAS